VSPADTVASNSIPTIRRRYETSVTAASDHGGAEPARSLRRAIRLVAVVLVVLLVLPWLAGRVVAGATVLDGLGIAGPRPLAPEVERLPGTLAGITVDRYAPTGVGDAPFGGGRRAILLVSGATPAGRDDRRVVAIAEALARANRIVVVPELEVYGEDLVPADVDRLVALTGILAASHGPIVIAGISFGASLGLVAAADPRVAGEVALVATFGAYADLAGVVQAATTGVSLVGDQQIPWEPHPHALEVVREQLLGLLDVDDRRQVQVALASRSDPAALPAELRAVHDLLVAEDPTRTMTLVESVPSVVRDRIEAVSPVRAGANLTVPVVALHATDDPVIPYGELARLGAGVADVDPITLVTFDHVGIETEGHRWWVTGRDLWQTTRFVDRVLRASR
jgi:pimeloyl-ACP methyl ester carboxylesterase